MNIQLKEIFDQLNIVGNVSVARFSVVFREVLSKDIIRCQMKSHPDCAGTCRMLYLMGLEVVL